MRLFALISSLLSAYVGYYVLANEIDSSLGFMSLAAALLAFVSMFGSRSKKYDSLAPGYPRNSSLQPASPHTLSQASAPSRRENIYKADDGFINLTEMQLMEVIEALGNGKRIEAVKLVRQYSGAGLKEAKDYVDDIG